MVRYMIINRFQTLFAVAAFTLAAAILMVGQSMGSNVGSSQVAPGTVIAYAGTTCPVGYLSADGSSLLRAGRYANLFSSISTAWGAADGTHFNLPDLRGRFLRGLDGGIARDPDRASRTASNTGGNTGDNVGSVQAQATRKNGLALTDPGHGHNMQFNSTVRSGSTSGLYLAANAGVIDTNSSQNSNATNSVVSNTTGITLGTGDNETRPINANVKYCIAF